VSFGTVNLPPVLSHHLASKGAPVFVLGASFLINLVHPVILSNSGPFVPSVSAESVETVV
jgi:hypothetical protein